jgi:hypothetical protein
MAACSFATAAVIRVRFHESAIQLQIHEYPEVDLLVQSERGWTIAEARSGSPVDASFFAGMETFTSRLPKTAPVVRRLVYGGSESQKRQGVAVMPWAKIQYEGW